MCTTDQPIADTSAMTPPTTLSRLVRRIARSGLVLVTRRPSRRARNPFADLDDYMRRDIGHSGYYDAHARLQRDRMIALALLFSRH